MRKRVVVVNPLLIRRGLPVTRVVAVADATRALAASAGG
jgi:hypothetical protein